MWPPSITSCRPDSSFPLGDFYASHFLLHLVKKISFWAQCSFVEAECKNIKRHIVQFHFCRIPSNLP
jgi:hypothetical protein